METEMVLLYVLIAVVTLAVYKIRRRMSYWKERGIPHDEPSFPMGNFTGFQKTRHYDDILKESYTKFKGTGPFAGFYFFQNPAVLTLDLELVKHVLIKDFKNFSTRGAYYNEKDDPLSAHLVNIEGAKWKTLRHKLSPTFTSGKMKFMYPTVVRVAEEFVSVFGEMVAQNATVEIKEMLARYTTDVIGTCAFGIDCNSLREPNAEFRIMGRKSFTERRHKGLAFGFIQSFPNLARLLGFCQTPQDVQNFFMQAVRETITYRETNKIHRNDFMDMLIDLKNNGSVQSETGETISGLTFEELAAQAFVFFTAGFETSSTTLAYALFELARNQKMQDRLRAEITSAVAKHNNEFTYECMEDMPYLNQVILETLRFHTIVPSLIRTCLKEYVVPGYPKYVIGKGMSVLIPAGAMHRDPAIYSNPNAFDPDHFSPEQTDAPETASFLGFGDGPRNCIGARFGKMQSRIGLALLIKNFKFTISSQTPYLKIDKKSFMLTTEGDLFLNVQ